MRKGLLLLVMLLMPSVCHSQTYTTGSGAIFTFTGTAPSAPCALTRGNQLAINSDTGAMYACVSGMWTALPSPGAVPAGMLTPIKSGACPSGWSEDDTFTGLVMLATTTAAGDVGTTGGSTSFTPAGSVSTPSFSGNAGTVPAQTFTGASDTTSSVSGGTPAGTNSSGAFSEGAISWPVGVPTNASGAFSEGAISWPAGVPTFAGTPFSSVINHTHTVTVTSLVQGGTTAATTGTHIMTSTATGGSARAPTSGDSFTATTANPAGGVSSITPGGTVAWPAGVPAIAAGSFTQPTVSWPAGVPTIAAGSFTQPTFAGSALSGHTHTVTPTGTNSTVSFTPSGTISTPAFSGTPATIQQPFIKVIWCSKN